MIKLKSLYEIRVQKPLRLNAKGIEELKQWGLFEDLFNKYIDYSRDIDYTNDYYIMQNIHDIIKEKHYYPNGQTNVVLLKEFIINETYLEEDDPEFKDRLNNILQYFS